MRCSHNTMNDNRIQRPVGLISLLGSQEKRLNGSEPGGCCDFESWYYRYNTTSSDAPRRLQKSRPPRAKKLAGARSSDHRQQSEYNLRRVPCQGPIGSSHSPAFPPPRVESNLKDREADLLVKKRTRHGLEGWTPDDLWVPGPHSRREAAASAFVNIQSGPCHAKAPQVPT